MGREIKRVALDFDYPINKMIWKGYHNPYSGLECGACGGSGYSEEMNILMDDWYGFKRPDKKWCHNITQDEVQALIDSGRLMEFTNVPINDEQREIVKEKIANGGNSWLPFENGYIPTAEEVNEWSKKGFGHDSINRHICAEARAKRLGIKETTCLTCDGHGQLWPDDRYRVLSEEFEWIDPPAGDGYQLWSTTTEGTPMSPVFAKPEDLARWLVDNNASAFGHSTASYKERLKFIMGSGWAPSAVMDATGMRSGVEFASEG